MESGQQKLKGMMKSKLVMSFYKAPKPSASPSQAGSVQTSLSTQKVSTFTKQNSFGRSDGYVHGPDGGGGDRGVDNKASSYISYVKERRILEELVITKNIGMKDQAKSTK